MQADLVRKSREASKAWATLISFLVDHMKDGYASEVRRRQAYGSRGDLGSNSPSALQAPPSPLGRGHSMATLSIGMPRFPFSIKGNLGLGLADDRGDVEEGAASGSGPARPRVPIRRSSYTELPEAHRNGRPHAALPAALPYPRYQEYPPWPPQHQPYRHPPPPHPQAYYQPMPPQPPPPPPPMYHCPYPGPPPPPSPYHRYHLPNPPQ